MSLKDNIFSFSYKPKQVKAWGQTLYLHTMSVGEALEYNRIVSAIPDEDALEKYLYMLVFMVRDKDGKPVFTVDDLPTMRDQLPLRVVERVALQALANNNTLNEDDIELEKKG